MFSPSRDQARQFFFETWRKYAGKLPLTPLESVALDIILRHPEYHPMLDAPDKYLERDYPPEFGETNPFLHLSLHLAIEEQLSIDQPAGIKTRYAQLLVKLGDAHAAQHAVLECLAEMIWQAQRHNNAPDSAIYFNCLSGLLAQEAGFQG
jgi:hypothetical protein